MHWLLSIGALFCVYFYVAALMLSAREAGEGALPLRKPDGVMPDDLRLFFRILKEPLLLCCQKLRSRV